MIPRVLYKLENDLAEYGNCYYLEIDNPDGYAIHRIPPFNCTITHLEID